MDRLAPLDNDYYTLDADELSDVEDLSSDEETELDWLGPQAAPFIGPHAGSLFSASGRKGRITKPNRVEDDIEDFDRECEVELGATFESHNRAWLDALSAPPGASSLRPRQETDNKGSAAGSGRNKSKKHSSEDPTASEDLEEDEESDDKFRQKAGMSQPSDMDLFYDPDLDENDQGWIDGYRRSCLPSGSKKTPLPASDAVLNCPGCMTVLCMDCQRHEVYKTQYRAMFVVNCTAQEDETVVCRLSRRGGGRKVRKRKLDDGSSTDGGTTTQQQQNVSTAAATPADGTVDGDVEDVFRTVLCDICKTQVAAYDPQSEVYHFFNVLASHS